ncbi:hypothetical protein [Caldimonas sp.]
MKRNGESLADLACCVLFASAMVAGAGYFAATVLQPVMPLH